MKKSLLIVSLVLLVLTMAAMGLNYEEYVKLLGLGAAGTGLLGAAYPAY